MMYKIWVKNSKGLVYKVGGEYRTLREGVLAAKKVLIADMDWCVSKNNPYEIR